MTVILNRVNTDIKDTSKKSFLAKDPSFAPKAISRSTLKCWMRVWVIGLVLAWVMAGDVVCGAVPGGPTNLRVNDVADPVGVGCGPFFGWHVNDPDMNEVQSGYQIVVSSSAAKLAADEWDLWDSGKVGSDRQNHVVYGGKELASDSCCYWKVRTWDKAGGVGEWSKAGRFVVGLLKNEDWAGASWVRRESDEADDYTYYRKKVSMPGKPVERVTVYVSSVHKYALYLNGELVGKGPAYNFPQYQYYNAYDITTQMRGIGVNQFAIFNHWFGGGQGRAKSDRGVIMKVVVHFADGSSMASGTDGSWLQKRAEAWELGQGHRNRGEGVGYIEKIDGGKLEPDWAEVDYDDSGWGKVTVIGEQPVEPWTGSLRPDLTRIAEREISPVSIMSEEDGIYLVDLGRVYAGVPRIKFSGGDAGEVVEMLGGYVLDDNGRINTRGNQSTNMSYYAVCDGGEFIYEPVEYLGMRYFEVRNPPMAVTKDNFSFVVRHSEMDEGRSEFESSDDKLDVVWDLMKHSLLTCGQEEFVDTPTREKGGFLGDAAIQSTVAMPVMGERVLTERVLKEYLQSMDHFWSEESLRGGMNAVYPNRDGRRDIPDFTQAYLVWVWNYYMETGDDAFLASNYAKFRDIAEYVYRCRDENSGLIANLAGGSGAYKYGIIDWPASMRFGYEMMDVRTVINSWAYADYLTVSKIAGVLGNEADGELYRKRAEELKHAMNEHLLNDAGVYVDGMSLDGNKSEHVSQHANMMPLALGIVPDGSREAVLAKVKEAGISVGMVTMPWLIRAIGGADEGGQLFEMYTNEQWPGWARCLARGATSTWESWYSDTAGESMSHAWGASGLEGYVRYILGVRPLESQYRKVLIKPLDFYKELDWVNGKVATDRGDIEVLWQTQNKVFQMQVGIPVNMTARIMIPKGRHGGGGSIIEVDKKRISSVMEDGYFVIDNIGSGRHTIVKRDF